jgi:hypothetical protein
MKSSDHQVIKDRGKESGVACLGVVADRHTIRTSRKSSASSLRLHLLPPLRQLSRSLIGLSQAGSVG